MSDGSAREVFAVSLRLGLTSFGGPIAHIGYQREAFVARLQWLDEDAFAELVALSQSLPGPASSQLSIAVGRLRAGWAGALAAWLGFTLPSAIVMTLIGVLAAGAGIPVDVPIGGVVAGLKAAAVAVVAHAVVSMARRLTPDVPRLLVAVLAAAAMLAVPTPFAQVALIMLGGIVGWVAWRGIPAAAPLRAAAAWSLPRAGTRRTAIMLLAGLIVVVAGSQLLAAVSGNPGVGLVAALVRAGALVFGGGHVVLPLLESGVVGPGWVGQDTFLAGYGAAQAMPGPLFSFAAYLGTVSSAGPGGAVGAIVATAAIFLPGALLVLAALPVVSALRGRRGLQGSLRGVNAVVVGILAAALVTPVGTAGVTSVATAIVAGVGAAALIAERVPPLLVVAASAGIMASLAAAGVA